MTKRIAKSALLGLGALALASSLSSAQVTTNLLSETTFDSSAPSAWGYGYFYGNNGLGLQQYVTSYYLPEDRDMTNGMWQYTFDITDLAGLTGYGTGTGGPLFRTDPDPTSYSSTNREDYLFSFDARVEGLDAASTNANAEMQVQFYYKDENGADVKSLQVNLPFTPGAQWQPFAFNLGQGSLGDNTADSEFAKHAAETTDVRFNVNLHEPHNAFGFDADNALYLDNVKLEVVSKPAVPETPKFGVPIVDWDMDDSTPLYEYHYQWSQNEIQPVPTGGNNANGNDPNTLGTDSSSAWFLNLDTTEFNNNPPQWAGGGSGGGGAADYTLFDTPELASYRVTFDARVSGLTEGQAVTAAVLQLFLESPDDTFTPVDENADADFIVQLNFPIARVSPNWQTYSYAFNKGSVGGGSVANFTNFFSQISGLRTQWQIENAGSLTDWGYDSENMLIIDNIKIERLYAGLGSLSVARSDNDLVLTWNAPAGSDVKLQESSTVDGGYTDVPGAASGYTTPFSGQARFFRLAQQ